jgi:membrane-associated phospholipid phosphatase
MRAIFDPFDLPILKFVTELAGKSHLLDHTINALSRFDTFKGVFLMCLFWYVWAEAPANEWPGLQEQRQKRLVLILVGSVLLGGVSRLLQIGLHVHQRPLLSNLGLPFPVTAFPTESLSAWNSFPSDHVMIFFALGTGLWSINRKVGAITFVWTLIVVGLPRIYLGIHYPSDVIFGALFGFLGMKLILALPLKRFERLLGAWRRPHQGLFFALLYFLSDQVSHLLGEVRELAHSSAQILLGH